MLVDAPFTEVGDFSEAAHSDTGDREGGQWLVTDWENHGAAQHSVPDSLHQELMICQTKALWSNIR